MVVLIEPLLGRTILIRLPFSLHTICSSPSLFWSTPFVSSTISPVFDVLCGDISSIGFYWHV